MEESEHQEDSLRSLSPVSELSLHMRSLQCQDSLTPKRRLQLTPEKNSPDTGPNTETETPKASMTRNLRKASSPEHLLKMHGWRVRRLREQAEEDEDAEDDKENTVRRKHVRVRLFSPSSPREEPVKRNKRQNVAETKAKPLVSDHMSMMLFQSMRSRRHPSHTSLPVPAVTNQHLIGDFSKRHILPVEKVDFQDLHCVSALTVASLIRGQYSSVVEQFLIVDCRYPYEFKGGHIKGAVNLYTESQIHQALLQGSKSPESHPALVRDPHGDPWRLQMPVCAKGEEVNDRGSSHRKLIVFHCEFSSHRGPRLCQFLRKLDRALNVQAYPRLLYPELYLLQGGYKRFYNCCPELCEPCFYIPMRHRDFREQLQRFSRTTHSHSRRRPVRSQQRSTWV